MGLSALTNKWHIPLFCPPPLRVVRRVGYFGSGIISLVGQRLSERHIRDDRTLWDVSVFISARRLLVGTYVPANPATAVGAYTYRSSDLLQASR